MPRPPQLRLRSSPKIQPQPRTQPKPREPNPTWLRWPNRSPDQPSEPPDRLRRQREPRGEHQGWPARKRDVLRGGLNPGGPPMPDPARRAGSPGCGAGRSPGLARRAESSAPPCRYPRRPAAAQPDSEPWVRKPAPPLTRTPPGLTECEVSRPARSATAAAPRSPGSQTGAAPPRHLRRFAGRRHLRSRLAQMSSHRSRWNFPAGPSLTLSGPGRHHSANPNPASRTVAPAVAGVAGAARASWSSVRPR